MANRYWVGGSADWDGATGTKWSTVSGGTGGAVPPIQSDDVFFDANSGSVTCRVYGTTAYCKSLNFTGFTGTFSGSTEVLNISGLSGYTTYFKLSSTMTWDYTPQIYFLSSEAGVILIDLAGKSISNNLYINPISTQEIQLDSDFVTTGDITHLQGMFQTNNHSLTCRAWNSGGTNSRIWNMGSSTINITGYGTVIGLNSTGLTINPGISNIILSSTSGTTTIQAQGKTFYDLTINSNVTASINDASEWNKITINSGADVIFEESQTHTVASIVTSGSGITISSRTPGTPATLSDASGTNTVSNATITDITASGGATWEALNCVDNGGNSGWTFTGTGVKTVNGLAESSVKTFNNLANASISSINGLV